MDKIVLDLGCGLRPHEEANVAVDIDPVIKQIERNVEKVLCDLNKVPWPFKDSSVDKIYCRQVLEHLFIHSFDFFRECYRILKPNGRLYLELPNAFHYSTRLRFLVGRYIVDTSFHPFHVKLLKPSYVVQHLRYLGFDVKLRPTTRLWHSIGLEQVFPDLFARSIALEARKRP